MENKANLELRNTIKQLGLKHWEVADLMGVSEATFVRKLRKELTEEEKEHILQVIKLRE